MSKIIYNGSFDIKGPILLELIDLERLDDIIEKEWNVISNDLEIKKKEEFERQKIKYPSIDEKDFMNQIESSFGFRKEKHLVIKCKTGNTIVSNTFKDASKEPAIQNEIPESFELIMSAGEFSTKISLKQYSTDELSIKITPEDYSYSRDLIYDLKKWVDTFKPNLGMKIWKSLHDFIWLIFGLICGMFSWIIIPQITSNELYESGKQLLKGGIDNSEINKALEIILAKEIGYNPNNISKDSTKTSIVILSILLFSLLLAITFSFIPKTNMSLGKGEMKVKKWKTWLKILFFIIPVYIVLPIIINIICQFI